MSHEDPGNISFGEVGGLSEQIRELREVKNLHQDEKYLFCMRKVVELPLTNPELFLRVGITPPKGCLLFGPPGKQTKFFYLINPSNSRHGENSPGSSSG